MPCLVAIIDCTHAESATASFKDFVTVARENSTNQTSTASFGLDTVSKEREVHKPDNRTEQLALPSSNSDKNHRRNKYAIRCTSVFGFAGFFSCSLTGSRNGVVVDVHWNI